MYLILCAHLPYSAYISQVLNFVNFENLEAFMKLNLLRIVGVAYEQPRVCQIISTKFPKTAFSKNLTRKNISAIRYYFLAYSTILPACSVCTYIHVAIQHSFNRPTWYMYAGLRMQGTTTGYWPSLVWTSSEVS